MIGGEGLSPAPQIPPVRFGLASHRRNLAKDEGRGNRRMSQGG